MDEITLISILVPIFVLIAIVILCVLLVVIRKRRQFHEESAEKQLNDGKYIDHKDIPVKHTQCSADTDNKTRIKYVESLSSEDTDHETQVKQTLGFEDKDQEKLVTLGCEDVNLGTPEYDCIYAQFHARPFWPRSTAYSMPGHVSGVSDGSDADGVQVITNQQDHNTFEPPQVLQISPEHSWSTDSTTGPHSVLSSAGEGEYPHISACISHHEVAEPDYSMQDMYNFYEVSDGSDADGVQVITDQQDHNTFEPPQVLQISPEHSWSTGSTTQGEPIPMLAPFSTSGTSPDSLEDVNQNFASETTGQIQQETHVKQPYDEKDTDHEDTPIKQTVDSAGRDHETRINHVQPLGSEDTDHETRIKQSLGSEETDHETQVKQTQGSEDTDHETRVKQFLGAEETYNEDTPMKYPIHSEHTKTEIPTRQHQSVHNTDPLIEEAVPLTQPNLHLQQPRNLTSCDQANNVNYTHSEPATRHNGTCDAEQNNSSSNEESLANRNHGNPVTNDTEQSQHIHGNLHQSASANAPNAELPLHDHPGIRDILSTVHVRTPNNMAANQQHRQESISLNSGSHSVQSSSMPSSAGVQMSPNEEEEEYAIAQHVAEAPPVNGPDDTESRYIHPRVDPYN